MELVICRAPISYALASYQVFFYLMEMLLYSLHGIFLQIDLFLLVQGDAL